MPSRSNGVTSAVRRTGRYAPALGKRELSFRPRRRSWTWIVCRSKDGSACRRVASDCIALSWQPIGTESDQHAPQGKEHRRRPATPRRPPRHKVWQHSERSYRAPSWSSPGERAILRMMSLVADCSSRASSRSRCNCRFSRRSFESLMEGRGFLDGGRLVVGIPCPILDFRFWIEAITRLKFSMLAPSRQASKVLILSTLLWRSLRLCARYVFPISPSSKIQITF